MKNPLLKRLPRELAGEFSKYLVILVLLITTIGFVSGFLVADESMLAAYDESFEKYNIEDGNFVSAAKLTKEQKKEIEKNDIKLYDNFYVDADTDKSNVMRIFKNRMDVNRACLMEGAFPEQKDEIAIDRMYADNNGIQVGDVVKADKKRFTVTGLVALSDYSTLFSDNNDMMFDSVKFGVAVVADAGFRTLDKDGLVYSYSWKYGKMPSDDVEEKEVSDKLAKKISKVTVLETFVPRYLNQAIQFTGADMGSDRSMIMILLYIVIVIMALVFAITTSNTIAKEAAVIGTLRASGYQRGELLLHYLTLPVIVTFFGAAAGNLLGYTIFKDVCAGMYYGSYSLPTYVTRWNADAFLLTTAVPLILMFVINCFILSRKLRLSPLQFLRRELRKNGRGKAFPLNKKIKFFTRFRLRIILQNRSNYLTLFIGIVFANLLLMFGLLLPALLDHYQEQILDNMICKYQYVLKIPMETENKNAEKFAMTSLSTREEDGREEQITVYGIQKESEFFDLDLEGDTVYVSDGFAKKYQLEQEKTFQLKERYGDAVYTFTLKDSYDYPASLAVFMDIDSFREVFDWEEDDYTGYFSDEKITDIEDAMIATVIERDDLTKVSRQLQVSMGNIMYLVDAFAVLIFLVVIYLLSKVIIEKNAQSISMAKILGYRNAEISRLYVLSTSIIVVFSVLASLPMETVFIREVLYYYLMSEMNGWLTFYVGADVYCKMVILGIFSYAAVALFEYRRIGKVPMNEALKNAE